MARSSKKKTAAAKADSGLTRTVQCLALLQKFEGREKETHSALSNGWACAYDDRALCLGIPLVEQLNCFPHTHRLVTALNNCAEPISFHHSDANRLNIKSGPFKASINCLTASDVFIPPPDPISGHIGAALISGFAATVNLVHKPAAVRLIDNHVLIGLNTVLATSGRVLMEFWHGYDLTYRWTVPYDFVELVLRLGKIPNGYGGSEQSFTLYFEDGSWLRTQRQVGEYPSAPLTMLDVPTATVALAPGLFPAAALVSQFSKDGEVYLWGDMVSSGPAFNDTEAATYMVPELNAPKIRVDGEDLAHIAPYAVNVDWQTLPGAVYFIGENCRGAVMVHRLTEQPKDRYATN